MAALQVQSQHHPTKREEQLLDSLHKILEVDNYKLDGVPTSYSLKELLSAKAIEMEATTNTSITALITLTTKPNDIVESFEKLVRFCAECPSPRLTEVAQIMYPVLVHLCIYLLSQEYRDHAKLLNDRHAGSFDSAQQADLSKLFSYSSTKEMLSSELVTKFREKKYCLRMSDKAFHLLMQFIQVLPTPFLLTVLERYLAIEVYGNTPVVMTDNSKPEPKKAITFTKPRLAKLDENRLRARMDTPTPLPPSSDFPAKVTSDVHMTTMTEYKEALAGAEMVDPTTPSVAIYCVHSTENNVHCASLNSTSKQYACGFADSSIHIWSQLPEGTAHFTGMARPHPIGLPAGGPRTLAGHSGPVYSTCFSDKGTFLISGSEDNTVRLWDLQSYTSVVGYHGHTYPIWDVSFSPIGVHFASASMDQTARLWTCDLTYPLRVFAGHTSSVNVVRFHPNGQYVATGSHDRTCRLWDIQSGQCVRLMPGCKSSVTSIAFSPNGKQLVSGGADGVTRIWDLGGGSLIKEYPAPVGAACKGAVSALTFSVDSNLMASSSHSNCINVYNMRRCGSSPPNTSEDILLSLTVSPKTCSMLHLQFTHRNCMVGIAKLENPSTTYSDLEPLHEHSNDTF